MSSMKSIGNPPSDRLHGLDALRGIALLLGVVLHASLAYFPLALWFVPDTQTSPVASILHFVIHLFRMAVFFLIAGLFAHMMLNRKGWREFTRDRLKRIAGPLFALWWLLFPAIVGVVLWAAWVLNGGSFPEESGSLPSFSLTTVPLTHLWFLWVLLILYAALLLIRLLVRSLSAHLDPAGRCAAALDRMTGILVGPWTPVFLAAPLALSLFLTPDWIPFFAIPTPDIGLIPNAAAMTGFGTAFAFGVMLDRRRDMLRRIERLWPVLTLTALVTGTVALMMSGGPTPRVAPITDPVLKGQMAVVCALAVFSATLAAVALALRFMSGYSTIRRYLADASYWIYIVHLPLVMAAQVLLLNVSAPWWAKFATVILGVTALALVTYELLVRHTFLGLWLNGRRVPWRRTPAVLATAE